MTTSSDAPLSELTATLCVLFIFLIPLAAAGLSFINTGLSRSRNAAHSMLASLLVFASAAGVYAIIGCAWVGYDGGPAHSITIAGKPWNWIAAEPLFLRGLQPDGSLRSISTCLQMFSVGLAALIPLGSGAERWRLGASCASTALLAGITYPLFAHWSWGGGWLAQLGVNCGLGRGFMDAGGAGSIQIVGGLTALAVAWILGPRRGKYSHEGIPAAMPGHNGVIVLFGCMLALLGWLGLNSAGALLFAGAGLSRVPLVAVNTTLAAAGALVTAALITRARFGRPDASLCANSWVGGLVAGSAGCAYVAPAAAIAIGLVAGALVIFAIEFLEARFGVDDPGGSISVHALSGIWGLLAVGLFARFPASSSGALSGADQWVAQLVGVGTLLGVIFPLTYGLNWLLNRYYPQRTSVEGERQGMDLHELGAGAYPEFATHTSDFMQM